MNLRSQFATSSDSIFKVTICDLEALSSQAFLDNKNFISGYHFSDYSGLSIMRIEM